MSRPDYFFIGGVGRSGTTALRKSLGLHPALDYNGQENNILSDVIHAARVNCTLPDRQTAMVVNQSEYDRIFERALNELLWRERAQKANQIRTAAFDPWPGFLEYLFQVFPNSKMLYLVRNGIEVVASRQLFEPFQVSPFEKHCEIWFRAHKVVRWGQDKPQQFRLVRHEWLGDADKLRQVLFELYEWLGIAWHDAPLQNLLAERYHPTHHPQETADTPEARAERWKFWTDAERASFETICGDAMRGFGYSIPWRSTSKRASAPTDPISARVRRAIDKTLNIITIQSR